MLVDLAELDRNALAAAIEEQYGPVGESLRFEPLGEDSWCYRAGELWVSVRRDLRGHVPAAYEAARELRDGGLDFVLAPLRGADGRATRVVDDFPVVVLPYIAVVPLSEVPPTAGERAETVEMLERLHAETVGTNLGAESYRLSFEADLDRAVAAAGRPPPSSGPYAARLVELLAAHRDELAAARDELAQLAAYAAARPEPFVLTHGEPIASNFLRAERLMLADWGELMWGPPERDWFHARASLGVASAGRPELMRFYELRWKLSEIAEYATTFLEPHAGGADDDAMWGRLGGYLGSSVAGAR